MWRLQLSFQVKHLPSLLYPLQNAANNRDQGAPGVCEHLETGHRLPCNHQSLVFMWFMPCQAASGWWRLLEVTTWNQYMVLHHKPLCDCFDSQQIAVVLRRRFVCKHLPTSLRVVVKPEKQNKPVTDTIRLESKAKLLL